ncbi:MAG TPA: MMPL family transporter [Thermoanaerobaculia bacterium]|nr:MMPL family transporter [Thermoanaerobaculia bacterium]
MPLSFEPVVRRRRWLVAAFALVTAACVPGLLRLSIDNSPEAFFVRDAEALQRLQRLEIDYGRDRGVRLVVAGEGLWTREGLARLAELEAAAGDPRRVGGGVYGAAGPVRHHRWHLPAWPPADPEAFRAMAAGDAVDRNAGWVGREGEVVTVWVGLFRMGVERQGETLERLEALVPSPRPALDPERGPAASIHASGSQVGLPVVVRALDDALVEVAGRLFPLLGLVAVALLLALFPPARGGVLLPLAPLALVTVTLTVLFGAMGYAGQRVDVVTVILAPLLFVIALATGIHVLAYHLRLRTAGPGLDPGEAVLATYRVKAWPVLWTGLTTCAGFGSLAVAETPPVRMLGLWAAFGIAWMTLAALSFYPALLAMGRPRYPPHPNPLPPQAGGEGWGEGGAVGRLSRLGRAWAGWAVARRRLVLGLFGAVALLAALGLPRLGTEMDVLRYFRESHPVREGVEALEARGVGAVSASLALALPEEGATDDPDVLRRLAALAAELRQEPLVLGALSAGDLAANVARYATGAAPPAPGGPPATRAPAGDEPLAVGLARMERDPELGLLLAAVRAGDGARTRIILFTRFRGAAELAPLYARAEAAARRAFPQAEAHVTGLYPLVLAAQRSVLRTMALSLTLTFLVIAAVLRWLLGSASLTLRALAPNAWPVLLVLGAMGWLGVALDGTTVMIGAVVLGLAVDDSLHTLGHFRRAVGRGGAGGRPGEAAVTALAETAPGHAATSAVLALGFAACALSSLVPVAWFGALAAFGIAGALAGDLLLVPALLAGASERAVARL